MTFSANDFSHLARACVSAAEGAVDADGFVPVRNLLRRFKAKLILRPLLVEAMLCQIDEAERSTTHDGARWAVLVDSERYPIDLADVENENAKAPLSPRFRNTIAHELAHSLSFRLEEFGIGLVANGKRTKNMTDAVKAIEKATERLSPILLVPPSALDRCFPSSKIVLCAGDVMAACQTLGVSRYVLINRLELLREVDAEVLRERLCFRNIAIGLGEMNADGSAVLRGWPIYVNFERVIVPATLWKAMDEKSVAASELLPDPEFVLNGGAALSASGPVQAGTKRFQRSEILQIVCTVALQSSRSDNTFQFVVTGSSPVQEPRVASIGLLEF